MDGKHVISFDNTVIYVFSLEIDTVKCFISQINKI